jgi:hypothetical protein
MSANEGELVTESFPYDGGRLVTVYVPPSLRSSPLETRRTGRFT